MWTSHIDKGKSEADMGTFPYDVLPVDSKVIFGLLINKALLAFVVLCFGIIGYFGNFSDYAVEKYGPDGPDSFLLVGVGLSAVMYTIFSVTSPDRMILALALGGGCLLIGAGMAVTYLASRLYYGSLAFRLDYESFTVVEMRSGVERTTISYQSLRKIQMRRSLLDKFVGLHGVAVTAVAEEGHVYKVYVGGLRRAAADRLHQLLTRELNDAKL